METIEQLFDYGESIIAYLRGKEKPFLRNIRRMQKIDQQWGRAFWRVLPIRGRKNLTKRTQ